MVRGLYLHTMLIRKYFVRLLCLGIILGSCKTVTIPVSDSLNEYYPAEAILETGEATGKAPSGLEKTAELYIDATFNINALPEEVKDIDKVNEQLTQPKLVAATPKSYLNKVVDEPQNDLPYNHNALLGFAFIFFGFSTLILPIIGFILCLRAINQINAQPEKYRGKGLAISGIVLFIVYTVTLFIIITSITGLIDYNSFF